MENLTTHLPEAGCWTVYSEAGADPIASRGMKNLAESMEMQTSTLLSLLEKTACGSWPVRIAGKLFTAFCALLDDEKRLVSIKPSTPEKTAALLETNTGAKLFLLCSSDGRILAHSKQTESVFTHTGQLASVFDSASSGAIQSAMRKCVLQGSVPEFLVSHTQGNDRKANYGITMQRLPTPGKLVFCRLQVPSVAVVTDTIDRNSIINTILEESFCPNITIDHQGVICSMNSEAKNICREIWGYIPTGSTFFDLIHAEQREAVINRHEQRKKGYAVPSRYTVQLSGESTGSISSVDVSVVLLHGYDRWVIFIRPVSEIANSEDMHFSAGVKKLLEQERITPEEALQELAVFTRATATAYLTETGMVTTGDSGTLIKSMDRNELAAMPSGFIKQGLYHQRINSGFGISHLLVHMPGKKENSQMENRAIRIIVRILESYQAEFILNHERKLLTLTVKTATAYLSKKESLDGLLSDFIRSLSIETAAVFRISRSGNFLKGTAGAGIVGSLPDLPLDELNTASWACMRSETAFYTGSPGNDVRFSRVFPESLSEIAVPFFRGTSPEGVILLADSERDCFSSSTGEFLQLLALMFSSRDESEGSRKDEEKETTAPELMDTALKSLIHGISGLQAAFAASMELLKMDTVNKDDPQKSMGSLLKTASLLEFNTRWALLFLRTSLYEGKPQQRWIDPSPLLEKTFAEMKELSAASGLELAFNPPPSDLEVCTDGSFVSMIAHCLVVCILDNTSECSRIELSVGLKEDHWTFSIDAFGDSVPGECLSTRRQPDNRNMAFVLAWKLTDELGGTISTFSNRGKSTRLVVRLRISG